ncbi:hypothetical protein MWU52_08055 [Jannaschia sp. S6380]|uniref:hypothetical protein n=1 Tax=Jannaschia sp. S6380 TaxID=2926408 RepID=UPI001FF54A6D|nr:hypothetical protein [Jannaschia sp. S6380]MCK0167496.1 hypothetical protein [Jannaschia sp. S6380]
MHVTKTMTAVVAAMTLAACNPPVPDSTVRGAGFDSPEEVAERREAQLRGQEPLAPPASIRPPETPPGGASGTQTEAERLAAETRAVLGRPETPEGFVNPVEAPAPLPTAADPPAAAPVDGAALDLDRDNPTISREQDFQAVSAARDIEADAERLRAARAQYQVVQPTELARPESTGPNIFAYALGPAKPVGTKAFRRGIGASANRAERQCQRYRSADVAQEEFLAAGGPERDRLGVDPDGDGNACGWNPAIVRNAVRN